MTGNAITGETERNCSEKLTQAFLSVKLVTVKRGGEKYADNL